MEHLQGLLLIMVLHKKQFQPIIMKVQMDFMDIFKGQAIQQVKDFFLVQTVNYRRIK